MEVLYNLTIKTTEDKLSKVLSKVHAVINQAEAEVFNCEEITEKEDA